MKIADFDAEFEIEEYSTVVELTITRNGEANRFELTTDEAYELADQLARTAAAVVNAAHTFTNPADGTWANDLSVPNWRQQ